MEFQETAVNMMQFQMSKIALMSAKICTRIRYASSLSWQDIEQMSTELDIWRQELPETLRLQNLSLESNAIPIPQKQALMLVHLVYIGTHLLLYQRMIRQPQHPKADVFQAFNLLQMPEDIQQNYTTFAQQLARIIALLYRDKCIFSRCWLIM
jgi:hypothetical protein